LHQKTTRRSLPALRQRSFQGGDGAVKDELRPELDALELRCLSLAARGRTREDITREADIARDRVDDAFATAMEKLQAGNVAEAIFRAVRMKLIS
jgi:DNA-binding CsgD family transcriptional regulator